MSSDAEEFSIDELVPVTVWRVVQDAEGGEKSVVILREEHGDGLLPIAVGFCEAAAIEQLLSSKASGRLTLRPLTHELLVTTITRLDAHLERGIITGLEHETFFARLVLRRGDKEFSVDARPSDVVCATVASGSTLYVLRSLIDRVVDG